MKKILNYVHGSLTSISSDYLSVKDPSKGEEIGQVVLSSKDDFNKIIESSILGQKGNKEFFIYIKN